MVYLGGQGPSPLILQQENANNIQCHIRNIQNHFVRLNTGSIPLVIVTHMGLSAE